MNTKAVISAIEHAMERTVNYPSLIEKIAYLDGLAATCEYPHPGHPMIPLESQWKKIIECRASYIDVIKEEELAAREEKVRLLTNPHDIEIPPELREEVNAMDLAPEEAVVVENPINTVLDMARTVLTPSDLQQAIDRTKREPIEIELHEPTPEDFAKIMQDKANALVTITNHEELGIAMFEGLDTQGKDLT